MVKTIMSSRLRESARNSYALRLTKRGKLLLLQQKMLLSQMKMLPFQMKLLPFQMKLLPFLMRLLDYISFLMIKESMQIINLSLIPG